MTAIYNSFELVRDKKALKVYSGILDIGGHRQVVRQQLPKLPCAGSNPVARSNCIWMQLRLRALWLLIEMKEGPERGPLFHLDL